MSCLTLLCGAKTAAVCMNHGSQLTIRLQCAICRCKTIHITANGPCTRMRWPSNPKFNTQVLCDRLGIFVDGQLVCVGAPKEITARYGGYLVSLISAHHLLDQKVKPQTSA